MRSLLWHTPVVLKQMARQPPLLLVGCVVCAGLILIGFGSISNRRPSVETPSMPAEIKSTAPDTRKLADPPLSPTRHRPEAPASAHDSDSPLRDVRLTGVVVGPDVRIAIFAVAGANSLMLSEGDALRDWQLESISPQKVVLSGPAGGRMMLEPSTDANLVRSPPPLAAWPGQLAAGESPGVATPSAPPQPIAVTPITIVNLPPPAPVQAQSYPYYPPEYYDAGYGQYFPSFNNYTYPFPYFAYVVPRRVRFGLGFGFFHHHAILNSGFHSVAFHSGVAFHGGMAFHGGGFGRRR